MKKNIDYYINLPYKTEIYYEKDDDSWIAFHPELGKASCYAIGSSKQEALILLDTERKSFIELLLSENQEIPLPKAEDEDLPSGQFVLRLPRSLHKKVKDAAESDNISVNQFVLYALAEKIGEIGGNLYPNIPTLFYNMPSMIKMDFADKSSWGLWDTFYGEVNKPNKISWGQSKVGVHELNYINPNIIHFRKKEQENAIDS